MLQVKTALLRPTVMLLFAAVVKYDGVLPVFKTGSERTTEQSAVLQNRIVLPNMYECMFNCVLGVELKSLTPPRKDSKVRILLMEAAAA